MNSDPTASPQTEPPPPFPRFPGCSRLGLWLLWVGSAYFASAGYSTYFTVWNDAVSYFWLPAGIYLAALLLTDTRLWGWLVLATGVGDILFNQLYDPWPVHFMVMAHAGNSASAILGAVLVRRWINRAPRIESVREYFGTVFLSSVLALPITATVGAILVSAWFSAGTGNLLSVTWYEPEAFRENWLSWFTTDLLGILIATPALLVWLQPMRHANDRRMAAMGSEFLVLIAGLVLCMSLSFALGWPQRTETLHVAFPFVVWAALRFATRGASAAILVTAIVAQWFNAFGFGAIGQSELSSLEQVLEMLVSLGIFSIVGMLPAISLGATRRADARTKESEERFHLAVRGSSAGVWDWDLATNHCFYAPRYRELLGYAPDDETGFPSHVSSFFTALHPDDQKMVRAEVSRHLEDPSVAGDLDFRLRTKSGDHRWFNARGEAERDAKGNPVRFAGSIIDITERKSLESQLQQSSKLEVIGQLAGGVAHDFNNILAAMTMNIELLRLDARNDEDREALKELHRLSKRAARLTEQLLMFARRKRIELAPLRLRSALREVVHLLKRLLPESVNVRFTHLGDPQWVRADSAMLDQAIINLCLNARDAMNGVGTLEIIEAYTEFGPDEHQHHSERRAGHFAAIRVRDDGCGMAPEILERIFEPFFTTKAPGKGTGLGLASVHGIVHQHEGWLEVESQEGAGSQFSIYLPLVGEPPETSHRELFKSEVPRGDETLLLVEDDDDVRKATARMLETLGYRVHQAEDAEAARACWSVQSEEIRLLFTDTVMPGDTNGLELARELLAQAPQLRVLLTSGYSEEINRGRDLREENIRFLPKPFSRQSVAQALRDCLG